MRGLPILVVCWASLLILSLALWWANGILMFLAPAWMCFLPVIVPTALALIAIVIDRVF